MRIVTFAVLAIATWLLVISLPACRRPTRLERMAKEQRSQLLAEIDREQAVEAHFRRLRNGTTSNDFRREFGKPHLMALCGSSDRECWYYDMSGQKFFVCFDQRGTVTCEGKVFVFP